MLVLPGQTVSVTATITPPSGVDASTFPVYSGFIQIESKDETLHVTYLGVANALKRKMVTDNTDEFFGVPLPTLLDSTGDVQDGPLNYTFVGEDFPTFLGRLAFGTPLLRIDLVSPTAKIPTTLNKRATPSGTFASIPIIGPVFEFDFIPRNSDATVSYFFFCCSS